MLVTQAKLDSKRQKSMFRAFQQNGFWFLAKFQHYACAILHKVPSHPLIPVADFGTSDLV